MASKMRSAVESYAKGHHISNEQATQELSARSSRASAGLYGDVHAKGSAGFKLFGNGGGIGFQTGGKAGVDWSDDDTHQATSNSRASNDARHDTDTKTTRDFKEASDYFTNRKVSESVNHTNNNATSRADQLSASLNSAKQSYDQYTTSIAQSHEYAEMASRTETMSGQVNEDLNQQFAQYIRKQAPHDADTLLTDTASPEVAAKRKDLAWSFVQSQVRPTVDNIYSDAKDRLEQNIVNASIDGGQQEMLSDYTVHKGTIENATADAGIEDNVKHSVDSMLAETQGHVTGTQGDILGASKAVDNKYTELEKYHHSEAQKQNSGFNKEKISQSIIPGASTPEDLLERAKNLSNEK